MSWTRALLAALAVCVLLLTGSVSCGSSGTQEQRKGESPSPVGELLDEADEEGRLYREVDADEAPEVGIEVQPNSDESWDVRLTVRDFRFSPAGTKEIPVAGQGLAHLYLDGRRIARLRTPEYRLPAELVPRGTHHITARLYADDGTAWAVNGEPVESTADITASGAGATASGAEPGASGAEWVDPVAFGVVPGVLRAHTRVVGADPTALGVDPALGPDPRALWVDPAAFGPEPAASEAAPTVSARATGVRTGGQGSPDRAGKAS